jgi:hypothetical protein
MDAMKTLSRFVAKFTSLIVAVLSCSDRVIFKGHRECRVENDPQGAERRAWGDR